MMDVGTHCQFRPECNQLDFLPFKCSGCKQIFCQEHCTAAAHRCPNAESDVQVIVCPVCALAVRLVPNEDPNATFERHQRSGCNPANYAKVHKKKKCTVKLCKEKLVTTNSIICKDCGALTCLRHRLAEDHSCPGPRVLPPSGFRAAFGNFFTGFNTTNGNTTSSNGNTAAGKAATTTAATPTTTSRMMSAKSKVSSVAKQASNSLQTQLQDYRSSHRNKNNPASPTTTNSTPAAAASERCPQCGERFCTVQALIDHASSAHSNGWASGIGLPVRPSSTATGGIERCPHCSASFDDPVALVHHVESTHRGCSKEGEACVLL